jgi:hypothetical protein
MDQSLGSQCTAMLPHENSNPRPRHHIVAVPDQRSQYCLQVTLKAHLRPLAGGLTPREAIAKFKTMQMVDVHIPTTDGRELLLSRYTQPEAEHRMLLQQLRLRLPEKPPPKIAAAQVRQHAPGAVAV